VRRLLRVIGLGVAAALLLAAPVSAGKPVLERVPIDDLFVDDFLSAECGAEITAHVTGHINFRVWLDDDGAPIRELNNYALSVHWTSEHGSLGAKDVGVDRVTYQADGSIVNVIVGNVQSINIPGQGRVYADVGQKTLHITFDENGEVTGVELLGQAGQHEGDQIAAVCSVLGG
jgi:hypothetical protein